MTNPKIKAIKAGRLIDGNGGTVIENTTILIENNKIKDVGEIINIPQGAEIIDATDKTVMPGMIDAHMHLFGSRAEDSAVERLSRSREVGLVKAVYDLQQYLSEGFTTVKDCGGMNGIFLKQSAAEGTLKRVPRIAACGVMLQNTLGTPYNYLPGEYVDSRNSKISGEAGGQVLLCDGAPECIKATRYILNRGADFIKIWTRRNSFFQPDELQAIIQTAAQADKFVTAHCDCAKTSKACIEGGVKTIDHAVGVDEEMTEIANKKGIIFVSTLTVYKSPIDFGVEAGRLPQEIERGKMQFELSSRSFQKIRKAGGVIALGTDKGGESLVQKYGSSAIELELLVKYADFTPMDVIVSATKNGAIACFMGDKTGTIEPGKLADIIVVDGDPLADITILRNPEKIKLVLLEGKIEIDRRSH
jgi:imidazolonepropionase-like amidohydrolase